MANTIQDPAGYALPALEDQDGAALWPAIRFLFRRWKRMLAALVAGAAIGAAGSYLIAPEFNSVTTFLPPQQQQSIASAALSALGPLAGLAGSAAKSPADEYVALMESATVKDRIVDRFKLMTVYGVKYRRDARKELGRNVQISVGKKDGLITVSVDDIDPRRAAAMANQFVEELRTMTSVLAVSEAQQRRVFFQKQLEATRNRLTAAQYSLQESGYTAGALKAEPKAAADEYARLRAEMTAQEVRLQTLRNSMTESSPEVQSQAAAVQALRSKVEQLEHSSASNGTGADYISKYREFKYEETLFDLMARQYELARIDESREGGLIQVVDPALPAELKTSPHRTLIAGGTALAAAALMGIILLTRQRRPLPVA